ncbi:NicO-domain-containing protein [Fistulina hepatica ATCC 64428]|uniref:Nickel/cobalt efflux system n=1 Tax=Fistulina hepatica ATCC 64428 TaxID=1128425 RepID=A0A0D6ZZT9_9AGAR|nr:NicO-domain-containing protein [Fistulina hepatica ATCC 64428]KIY44097.1 NicO-domain-containing protein [Fistulina hepatica ATCC 64428]
MALTLFGRSLLLITVELLSNAVLWIVCAILFGRKEETRRVLSLALLAWTLGLRHALDADHISAIDNATRRLIALGQLPVTCGLFFSLGHSTVVILVNVAIAVSTDIYEHLTGVGSIGGIVGDAVSGSFLFIVGLANSIILYKIIRRKRHLAEPEADEPNHSHMLMMRILGPVITFVNRPWKMYPVGLLFGFGFDTASSIALLAISALAKDDNGNSIPPADIVVLPLLFTAGMTLIDSCDSVVMLYSYAGFPEHGWKIFDHRLSTSNPFESAITPATPSAGSINSGGVSIKTAHIQAVLTEADVVELERRARATRVKANMMSSLSIVLTLISILVAFSISLIEIMGLVGENCASCQEAANDPNGGGLAGAWWRGWANANDESGYIGAAIVGLFVAIVAAYYGGRPTTDESAY